jgi:chromosome segregation ATPase
MTTTAAPLESLAQRIARQQSQLEALQRDYEARQSRLAELKAHRDEMEEQLRRLDVEMEAVKQGTSKTSRASATA